MTRSVCGAVELFHMCRVCQIKLNLVDKGPFTHRWMGAAVSAARKPAAQSVSKSVKSATRVQLCDVYQCDMTAFPSTHIPKQK